MSIRIRMCVICRKRDYQSSLVRLQVVNNELVCFQGSGRSFYVCHKCIANEDRLNKYLYKKLKIKQINHLCKEMISNG